MATQKVSEMKELKIDSAIQLNLAQSLSPSTEIWLIQWPFDHDKSNTPWPKFADFEDQQATLNLNTDGEFGSLHCSSGKSYELRSMDSHTPEEVVILPSASETEIVGRISRHVSLIHYPEPSDLRKTDKDIARKLGQISSTTSLTGSARRTATPTQTIRSRHHTSTGTTSTHSSRKKGSSSVISGSLESSKSKKRKHASDASGSLGHSDRDSGKGHSTVTSSGGSHTQSREKKKKKHDH